MLFELIALAGGPPDPKVKPRLNKALETYAGAAAKRAQANPIIRANALMPDARLGLREEMKQVWGFDWRSHVRGVSSTLDVIENLAFREKTKATLGRIEKAWSSRFSPGFTLDPALVGPDRKSPHVVVVAANQAGEIVRYYESAETAPYFGSPYARDAATGRYEAAREPRRIASTGKIIAAIGIANEGKDGAEALYHDAEAPAGGAIETCARGGEPRGRRAIVAFACSLNRPVEWRAAHAGQERIRRIIDRLGFNMPVAASAADGTPPSTAAVRGLVSGSPQRVHHMASVVLAALTGRGNRPVRPPSLVKSYDFVSRDEAATFARDSSRDIVPGSIIRPDAHGLLRTFLKAPLCHTHAGQPVGTLKDLAGWCADRRADLRLHFAKTGTDVTADASATVDTWITGGLQFASGAAYSYVVLVGTGSTSEPWARNIHAAQVATPLLETLLTDLAEHAKRNPVPSALPPRPVADCVCEGRGARWCDRQGRAARAAVTNRYAARAGAVGCSSPRRHQMVALAERGEPALPGERDRDRPDAADNGGGNRADQTRHRAGAKLADLVGELGEDAEHGGNAAAQLVRRLRLDDRHANDDAGGVGGAHDGQEQATQHEARRQPEGEIGEPEDQHRDQHPLAGATLHEVIPRQHRAHQQCTCGRRRAQDAEPLGADIEYVLGEDRQQRDRAAEHDDEERRASVRRGSRACPT